MVARTPRAAIGLGGLVLSLGLRAGCATVSHRDPGVPTSDRERDENACLRASVGFNDDDFLLRLPLRGPGGQGERS